MAFRMHTAQIPSKLVPEARILTRPTMRVKIRQFPKRQVAFATRARFPPAVRLRRTLFHAHPVVRHPMRTAS